MEIEENSIMLCFLSFNDIDFIIDDDTPISTI
jgi:hypothetical protein